MESFINSEETQGIIDILNKCLEKKDIDAQHLKKENKDLRETVYKLTLDIEEYKQKLNDFENKVQVMEQNKKDSTIILKEAGKDEENSAENMLRKFPNEGNN